MPRTRPVPRMLGIALMFAPLAGCHYAGVHRPTVEMGIFSAEVSDAELAAWLDTKPVLSLPSDLLVVRLRGNEPYAYSGEQVGGVEPPTESEAALWRSLANLRGESDRPVVGAVSIAGPVMVAGKSQLSSLRAAAARARCPLIFAYTCVDNSEEGYNDASLLYWTIVGLWVAPGTVIGYYSAAQGVLIDTRTGQIVAIVDGECKHEESVTAAARDIAKTRARNNARDQAVARMHESLKTRLAKLPSAD